MSKDWNVLSNETKSYINDRFAAYDISGFDAFNDESLFPDEIRSLDSKQIIELLKTKDISHVMPKSQYPELESNLNNIVLEDSAVNRSRGAQIMTDDELSVAKEDYLSDIDDLEESLNMIDTLPEVLLGSTVVGLGLSSIKAYQKVKTGEILINETPRFIAINSGGKMMRCAIIGACASSGAPILVAAAFGYTLYKSKGIISNAYEGALKVLSHPVTVNIASFTGDVSLAVAGSSVKVLNSVGRTTWNIANHETTKNIAIGTVRTSGKIIENTARIVVDVATHKKTKNIVLGTLKTTGKVIEGTAKGLFNAGKWFLNKK